MDNNDKIGQSYMIRNIVSISAIILCVYVATAQPVDGVVDTNRVIANSIDTLLTTDYNAVDTLNDTTAVTVNKIVDTTRIDKGVIDAINLNDDELLQAAINADSTKVASSTQKLDLIRREYEYKKQTRAAIIMMIFIAVAMATSQSWNPR